MKLIESLKHIIHKDKLLVDLTRHSDLFGGSHSSVFPMSKNTAVKGKFIPEYTWTNWTKKRITEAGYRRAYGLMSEWIHMFCPVYVRFHGWNRYHIEQDNNACLDTANSLFDFYKSNATKNFIKGMTKAQRPDIENKTLLTIAIVGAGCVLGFFLLFGGGVK